MFKQCTQHIVWLYYISHMVKDHSAREESLCCHYMDYSFWLAARDLLYAPFHRQDRTYQGIHYTSCVALAGTRNSSMGPPWGIDPTTTKLHLSLSHCYTNCVALTGTRNSSMGPMRDWSTDYKAISLFLFVIPTVTFVIPTVTNWVEREITQWVARRDQSNDHKATSRSFFLHHTNCEALAGTQNSSMGPPRAIKPTKPLHHDWMLYYGATSCSLNWWVHSIFIDENGLTKEIGKYFY